MIIRTIAIIIFSIGLTAGSVYVYTLVDPRLDIILLKNEEIMQLDNKIADLTEANSKLNEQVSSIATAVKSNESSSGKINDEYKVCLRKSDRLKSKNRRLIIEVSTLKNKNKILQEYVQVKNDVTALKEQISNLNQEKQQLTEDLGTNVNMNLDAEGAVISESLEPVDEVLGNENEPNIPDVAPIGQ